MRTIASTCSHKHSPILVKHSQASSQASQLTHKLRSQLLELVLHTGRGETPDRIPQQAPNQVLALPLPAGGRAEQARRAGRRRREAGSSGQRSGSRQWPLLLSAGMAALQSCWRSDMACSVRGKLCCSACCPAQKRMAAAGGGAAAAAQCSVHVAHAGRDRVALTLTSWPPARAQSCRPAAPRREGGTRVDAVKPQRAAGVLVLLAPHAAAKCGKLRSGAPGRRQARLTGVGKQIGCCRAVLKAQIE